MNTKIAELQADSDKEPLRNLTPQDYNSTVQIKQVKTIRGLKEFVKFQYRLYAENPYWVPPLFIAEMDSLRWDKNPAFESCEAAYWLAYKNGVMVGRIAGIINHTYIEKWGIRNARFGWLDFIEDHEVSGKLLETVENWAKENGMEGIHGPLGFCDLDKEGMLVEGFNELGNMVTIYNYPYYPKHLEYYGYTKDVDWLEYEIEIPDEIPARIKKVSHYVMKRRNLTRPRAKSIRDFYQYGEDFGLLLNEAYQDLYGVVPLSKTQRKVLVKDYLSILIPDYMIFLMDQSGKLAGFVIGMPSLTEALKKTGGKLFPFGFISILRALKKNNPHVDMLLIGVRPDYQNQGVKAVLLAELIKSLNSNQVHKIQTAPQLETNRKIIATWKHFNYRQHKRRRCYIKSLLPNQKLSDFGAR